MVGKFKDYVRRASVYSPPMPLVHTTDTWTFRSVLGTNELQPQHCPAFKEDLLYLFYGRPAYRPHYGRPPTSVPGYAPVCFVLTPGSLGSIKRVYPFDSGAFLGGRFAPAIHERMQLEDFDLDPIPDAPPRVVAAFFGSNKNYYVGKVLQGVSIDPLELEVQCFYNLICVVADTEYDDRRSSIEIQVSASISLAASTVLAVALPRTLLDSKEVRTTLDTWKADPLPYETYHAKPMEFVASIYKNVMDFLERKAYL